MAKITSNTVSQLLSAVGGSGNVSKCGKLYDAFAFIARQQWFG